ncbi:MAG: insulinase family protein [candidate division WOR-3 bacterium]|nr:insulinase family protein [candidate division WOR-3 bacterium]
MENIQKTQINRNIQIITEEVQYLNSASLGIFFYQGSRNEEKDNQGITHLIEHMLLKGTKNKSATDISYLVESRGSIIDAFTSKEITGVYSRFLVDNSCFDFMADLLCEIITDSVFDEQELAKEKNVIVQEILESQEDPSDAAFSLLFEALFPQHPLSFQIAGTLNSIQTINRDYLVSYYRNNHLNTKICVVAVGKVAHEENVSKFQSKLTELSAKDVSHRQCLTPPKSQYALGIQPRNDLNQVYCVLGNITFSYQDERKYALSVINTALGGSLSSRLFQRLREKEGLVYTISTFGDLYVDIGVWGLYFITDNKNLSRVINIIFEENKKLKKEKLSQKELELAINFCKGNLVLGLENPMSRMMRIGKNELLLNRVVSIKESLDQYTRLSLDEVNDIIDDVININFAGGIVGPINEQEIRKIDCLPKNIFISNSVK